MTEDAATTVLVHSPLTSAAAWGDLPSVLRGRGHQVAVVDVADDDAPPFAARFVARAALQVREQAGDRPVLLVGHSGAGYLLPLLGAARRAARAGVAGYVFLDAALPPARPTSRLDLMRAEVPDGAGRRAGRDARSRRHLPGLDRRPTCASWSRTRRPGPRWSRRCGPGARTSSPTRCPWWRTGRTLRADCCASHSAYDGALRLARLRGWPVLDGPDDRPGGHFAALVDPGAVADDLEALLARM